MEEKVFLDQFGVTVTNARFMVPNETYAMNGVVSVKKEVIPGEPGRKPLSIVDRVWNVVVAVVLLGGGAHLCFSSKNPFLMLLGVVLFLMMLFFLWVIGTDQGEPDGPPKYAVVLRTSAQEVKALEDENREFIDNVVSALNAAIVARG